MTTHPIKGIQMSAPCKDRFCMKRYEYMTRFIGGAPAQDGPALGLAHTPHLLMLNDAGDRGWELVSMTRYGEGFYAIFKRDRHE